MPLSPINLSLHPKQGVALESRATEMLFGGSVGGGKSHVMRVAAILWCAAIPGLQVYLFRRISDDLIKNHMEGPKGFPVLLARWVIDKLVEIVEGEIRFWNGSKIYLCHCKDEKDRFKYLGAEIHVLLIDELTTFTDMIYRFLRGRVRMVGINLPEQYKGLFPRIVASSNPGNIGHQWVKRTFIDDAVPMEIRQAPPTEGGMLRQYIPAKLADNPSMVEDDPLYEKRLSGLGSEALVKAMKDGDWNVIAGAYFDCWETDKHVIKPFAIPSHWTKFMSMDWGSSAPFSVGWWAVSDGSPLADGRLYPTGAMIRYREWYGASEPNVGIKLTAEQLAEGIAQREITEPYRANGERPILFRVADPSCWKVDGGPSIAERIARKGLTLRPADNSRVNGWDQVRARLQGDEDSGPMIYCFETCVDTVRTIPVLQHDEDKPEDVDTDGEDHAADEWRYACMARPYTRKSVTPAPIRGITDITMNELWKAQRQKPREERI